LHLPNWLDTGNGAWLSMCILALGTLTAGAIFA
jgi:hypothetical protein